MDFEYNGYKFSMPGDGFILLSQLFEGLHIERALNEVFDVSVDDTSLLDVWPVDGPLTYLEIYERVYDVPDAASDELIVSARGTSGQTVDYVDADDWVIVSLSSFTDEHTVTIRFTDGTVISIKAVDPPLPSNAINLATEGVVSEMEVSPRSESVTVNEQSRSSSFTLDFSFKVSDATLTSMKSETGASTLVYDLTEFIQNNPVKDLTDTRPARWYAADGTSIGQYQIVDNKLILTLSNKGWLNRQDEFIGTFALKVTTDETKLGLNDEWHYEFPVTDDDITIHYKKINFSPTKTVAYDGTKEGDAVVITERDGYYYLDYTVTLNVPQNLNDLVFTDTIGGNQQLVSGSMTVNNTAVTPTTTASGFSFNVGQALGAAQTSYEQRVQVSDGNGGYTIQSTPANGYPVSKGTYTVKYQTRINKNDVAELGSDLTVETNWADWTADGTYDVPGPTTSIKPGKPTPSPTPSPTPTPTPEPTPTPTPTPKPVGNLNIRKVVTTASSSVPFTGDQFVFEITFTGEGVDTMTLTDGNGNPVAVNGGKATINMTFNGNGDQTITLRGIPDGVAYTVKELNANATVSTGFYKTSPENGQASGWISQWSPQNANFNNEFCSPTPEGMTPSPTPEVTPTPTPTPTPRPTPEISKAPNTASNPDSWVPEQEITYTATLGGVGYEWKQGDIIYDEMTHLADLVGGVTISLPNDQTVQLPESTDIWNVDGVTWNLNQDVQNGTYNENRLRVFRYSIPEDMTGAITVTYKIKILDAEKAKQFGIYGNKHLYNYIAGVGGSTHTDDNVDFPEDDSKPKKTVSPEDSAGDGWQPGQTLSYTLTYGNEYKDMANVRITDAMTETQELSGDVTIKYKDKDGTVKTIIMPVSPSGQSEGVTWFNNHTSGEFSTNLVEVFQYNLPSDAGKGPVEITYSTVVATEEQAMASGLYNTQAVNNKFSVYGDSAQTEGDVPFPTPPPEPEPTKEVTPKATQVEGLADGEQGWVPGEELTFTITYGDSLHKLDHLTIYDSMTQLAELVGDVSYVIRPGADDEISGTLPVVDGASGGVTWGNQHSAGVYNNEMKAVFNYTFPENSGLGPVVITYTAKVIDEDTALAAGVWSKRTLTNTVSISGKTASTSG